MHRRMPVVATIERWRELARRTNVAIDIHRERDLVRILLMHALQRKFGEYRRRGHIELIRRSHLSCALSLSMKRSGQHETDHEYESHLFQHGNRPAILTNWLAVLC